MPKIVAPDVPRKIVAGQAITAINDMRDLFDGLSERDQIKALKKLGVGAQFFTCQYCGEVKERSKFYVSTEPGNVSGLCRICKDCAADIAMPVEGETRLSPTKGTVDNALRALNKPFLDSVWDASINEAANQVTGKTKNNVWTSYVKNIQLPNYYSLTYTESDNYISGFYSLDDDMVPKDQEIVEQFEKNKQDTLRLLGYLPFEKEKLSDQPFLYSQLIGFLDSSEEGNDDMMRISSIISIVRGFLQESQIDDMIAGLVKDPRNATKNVGTVKSLQEMKKNITLSITKLAESSCISLKHSKNSVKGENTWTGKIKKIKDLDLRSYETNGFDMATCRSMQQVQEISDASILKQLHLDESEFSDMIAEMRVTNTELRKERDSYKEINRLLLRENIDLKDTLEENEIDVQKDLLNLKDVYSVFSPLEEESDGEEVDEDDSSTIPV